MSSTDLRDTIRSTTPRDLDQPGREAPIERTRDRLPAKRREERRQVFPTGLIPARITSELARIHEDLPSDEPQHRWGQTFLGGPGTPGMPEQARLHREAETIAVGPMPTHEVEIRRPERVQPGDLERVSRQRK